MNLFETRPSRAMVACVIVLAIVEAMMFFEGGVERMIGVTISLAYVFGILTLSGLAVVWIIGDEP
jgi:hypothetical protein